MSPAHVLEPTFESLKRKLMEGAWPQGEKLEALRLADEFGVSMTPVRDCLNRLVGERLVDMKPGEGYRVRRISEQCLRDMLDVNLTLLDHALSADEARVPSAKGKSGGADYADVVAELFASIASRGENAVLSQAVRSLSERMHVVRKLDPQLFPDTSEELDEMKRLSEDADSSLHAKLHAYHERRHRSASALIRLLT